MVLEQFIDRKLVRQHFLFVFFLSAVFVFISYGVTELFFPGESLPIVLLTTLLLVPSLHHLIQREEKIERTGSDHFWKRHKGIIKCYFGAFAGLLFGFIALGIILPSTLDYQLSQLQLSHLHPDIISKFVETDYVPDAGKAAALFTHNLGYLLLGFVLSIFYGAGAVFIIAFNASFFAAFVLELLSWNMGGKLAGMSLTHLFPETLGFLLAAIAGATISRALIHEKLRGQPFRNVLQNGVKLLLWGIVFIGIAAVIEVYVTAPYFHRLL